MTMKSITVLKVVAMSLLVMGFSSSAYAQHCNVRPNDTIWHIAKRYHIDFNHLKELNDSLFKDLDLIHPNDKVDLPDNVGQSTNSNSSQDTIQEGNNNTLERGEVSQMVEVLNLVNAERKKQGLKPLVLNHSLNGVAMEKAFDMKENNYFSHIEISYLSACKDTK